MIIEFKILIPSLVAGILTFFVLAKLVEKVPYNLMLSWQHELDAFENKKIKYEDFKIGNLFRAMIVVTAISKSG